MKFMISRTSKWDDDKPHELAYKDEYIRVDIRATDDPTKIPAYRNNPDLANQEWYGEGSNHRVENGKIKRDFKEYGWFIDIHNLEQLIEFVKSNGNIILGDSMWNEDIFEIEIYDYYRE